MKLKSFIENNNVYAFPGRFQPFHLGHLATAIEANKKTNLPVLCLIISSNSTKNPFPSHVINNMMGKISIKYPFIKYLNFDGKVTVSEMYDHCNHCGYTMKGVVCGEDREKDYQRHCNFMSDTSGINLNVLVTHNRSIVSATDIRNCLKNDDQTFFNNVTPKILHNFYEELKKYV